MPQPTEQYPQVVGTQASGIFFEDVYPVVSPREYAYSSCKVSSPSALFQSSSFEFMRPAPGG
jgi:hypothetical protein